MPREHASEISQTLTPDQTVSPKPAEATLERRGRLREAHHPQRASGGH